MSSSLQPERTNHLFDLCFELFKFSKLLKRGGLCAFLDLSLTLSCLNKVCSSHAHGKKKTLKTPFTTFNWQVVGLLLDLKNPLTFKNQQKKTGTLDIAFTAAESFSFRAQKWEPAAKWSYYILVTRVKDNLSHIKTPELKQIICVFRLISFPSGVCDASQRKPMRFFPFRSEYPH